MSSFEVRVIDRDGDLKRSYVVHCVDILAAHQLVGARHGENAVSIRAIQAPAREPVSIRPRR